jgi:hypothetical protein
MKRKLYLLVGAIAVLVVAYISSTIVLGSIVKAGVNRFAPSITRTTVHLDGARLSPISGSGTLTGLLIGNPGGWPGDKAFYIGKIHVEVAPASIFSDCIVLNEVRIDSPEFVYETKVVSSNIGDLLKNIQGSSSDQPQKAQQPPPGARTRKFMVKHFTLTNGHVALGIGPTALTLPMPTLNLQDLGTREGGITPAALTLDVMRSVTLSIVTTTTNAAAKIVPTLGAAAGNSAKSAGDAIKSLFGSKK